MAFDSDLRTLIKTIRKVSRKPFAGVRTGGDRPNTVENQSSPAPTGPPSTTDRTTAAIEPTSEG